MKCKKTEIAASKYCGIYFLFLLFAELKGCTGDDECINGRCANRVCKCYDGYARDKNGECLRRGNIYFEGIPASINPKKKENFQNVS